MGGTAASAARLLRHAGGEIPGVAFVLELTFLGGPRAQRKAGVPEKRTVSLGAYLEGMRDGGLKARGVGSETVARGRKPREGIRAKADVASGLI